MNVAIIGCGQLAMMMAHTARKLNIHVSFIANQDEDTSCIAGLGEIVRYSPGMSAQKVFQRLGEPQVVTVEREQVDLDLLRALEKYCRVYPNVEAIAVTRDRVLEKKMLQHFNFPTARFEIVDNLSALKNLPKPLRPPLFIKHPTMGYDGKSQWRVESLEELDALQIDAKQFPLVAEGKVDFLYEASLIGVRSQAGETRYYPATLNEHRNGILLKSYTSPNQEIDTLLLPAKAILSALLQHWDYVGVLSLELFVTRDGLVVNELAPRVHNSGHWTMDACACSQFENHMRAITGLALGDVCAKSNAGMVNLLGINSLPHGAADHEKVYWYNKNLKLGRKMGHINLLSENPQALEQKQNQLIAQLYSA